MCRIEEDEMKRVVFCIIHMPFMVLGFICGIVYAGFLGGIRAYNLYNEWSTL
jgi:hypothetical protein